MPEYSTVYLRPGEAERVRAGHPWIYEGSIQRLTGLAADGAVVQVKDHRRRPLGIGFYNSKSKIRVRMLEPERVEINEAWFERKIRAAFEVRKRLMPQASSFRVVNAESDFLSGLIVDKYEDYLVVQISSIGMEQRKNQIVAVLQRIFSPRGVIERSDTAARKFEGLAEAGGQLAGEMPAEVEVKLNGLSFVTNLGAGQKTGLYLDQQANYELVSRWAKGGQVLDAFCFMGGFALHAARAGAAHVHGIDQSAEAVAAAGRNAAANRLEGSCSFEAANVFDWLKAQTVTPPNEKLVPKFDLIILDPPSFTRNRAAVPDALRGYKEIHLRALKLLKPGGVLATFCCSHHVDGGLFEQIIMEAAADVRRILRRVAVFSQSADHPVLPVIPETEYLKGFAYEIAR